MTSDSQPPVMSNWEPVVVGANDISETSVNWLFQNRLPAGMLTLLSGDPDVGKTFFSMHLAAAVTTGGCFTPAEPRCCGAGNVLVIHAEDSADETLLPRFVAAGGDRSRLHFTNCALPTTNRSNKDVQRRSIDLRAHYSGLKLAVERLEPCRLIIVDPIGSFMSGKNSYKDEEVREILGVLVELAAETRAAVLAVAHHKKGETNNAQHMVMGSVAFTAVPRMVYSVYRDPRDSSGDRRLLLPVKHNITRKSQGFGFKINGHKYNSDEGVLVKTAQLEWDEAPLDVSVQDVLRMLNERNNNGGGGRTAKHSGRTKTERARAIIQRLLSGCREMPAGEVIAIGKDAEISERTMRKAAKDLGVVTDKGYGTKANWSLPQSGKESQNSEQTTPKDTNPAGSPDD